jgi:hypothetical protein
MTTPLFPENNSPPIIRQGNAGDCYLLASLDCIFNLGQEGYDVVKSMFTETEKGVEVRIKHTDQSKRLQKGKLECKYDYYYDEERQQDVIIVSKEILEQIDEYQEGVISNSLAVKILERLTSYYYASPLPNQPLASIAAHEMPRRLSETETSTKFAAKFLGIGAHDVTGDNINEIIKLKTIAPEYPVYISIAYGNGRHALRIDKIVPNVNSDGEYDFVLVNPHDNQERETYSLGHIILSKPRFCTFTTKPYQHELTQVLLSRSFPTMIGEAIFANPKIFDELCKELAGGDTLLGDESIKQQVAAKIAELALKTRNQQLYNCLCFIKFDFQKYIEKSKNKTEKIRSIFEMEKNQPEINVKLLKDIIAFAQLFNKSYSSKIELDFDNQGIFEMVLNRAIKAKAEKEKVDVKEAEKIVVNGLIKYYDNKNCDCLTRSGNLRLYFNQEQELFNFHHIKLKLNDWFGKKMEQINKLSVSFYEINSKEDVKKHEQSLIQELTKLNDSVPDQIIKFDTEPDRITNGDMVSLFSDYRSAFEGKVKEIKDAAAKRVTELELAAVNEYLKAIKDFSVSFEVTKTSDNVDLHTKKLYERFQILVNNVKLVHVAEITGFSSMPELHCIIEEKKQEIHQAAILRKIELLGVKIHFTDTNSQDIFQHRNELFTELEQISRDSSQCTPTFQAEVSLKLGDCRKKIDAEFKKAKNKLILRESHFPEYLQILDNKVKEVERQAKDDNYRNAANVARELYNTLNNAKVGFLNSEKRIALPEFQYKCIKAINYALPLLEKHQGWKELLADIASVVLTITTLGMTYLATGQFWFLSPKKDCVQTINKLKDEINSLEEMPSKRSSFFSRSE